MPSLYFKTEISIYIIALFLLQQCSLAFLFPGAYFSKQQKDAPDALKLQGHIGFPSPSIFPNLIDSSQNVQIAHREALELYRSLELKSTCHRDATRELSGNCDSVSNDSAEESFRVLYALKLAICEFRSTRTAYPPECDNIGHNPARSEKEGRRLVNCLKRLEERPQYWTTLSNNLQNVMVLCIAARQELEKENILSLYKNITKVQLFLYDTLENSLNNMFRASEFTTSWTNTVRNSQAIFREELVTQMASFDSSLLQANKKVLEVFEEISNTIQGFQLNGQNLALDLSNLFNDLNRHALFLNRSFSLYITETEGAATLASKKQTEVLEAAFKLAENLHTSLSIASAETLRTLLLSVEGIFSKSLSIAENLERINLTTKSLSEESFNLGRGFQELKEAHVQLAGIANVQRQVLAEFFISFGEATESVHENLGAVIQRLNMMKEDVNTIAGVVHKLITWGYYGKNKLLIFVLIVGIGFFSSWNPGILTGHGRSFITFVVGMSLIGLVHAWKSWSHIRAIVSVFEKQSYCRLSAAAKCPAQLDDLGGALLGPIFLHPWTSIYILVLSALFIRPYIQRIPARQQRQAVANRERQIILQLLHDKLRNDASNRHSGKCFW